MVYRYVSELGTAIAGPLLFNLPAGPQQATPIDVDNQTKVLTIHRPPPTQPARKCMWNKRAPGNVELPTLSGVVIVVPKLVDVIDNIVLESVTYI